MADLIKQDGLIPLLRRGGGVRSCQLCTLRENVVRDPRDHGDWMVDGD